MGENDEKFRFMISVQISMQRDEPNSPNLNHIKKLVYDTAEAEGSSWHSCFGNCSALGKSEDGMTYLIELEAGHKYSLLDWEDYENFARSVADKITGTIPGKIDYAVIVPMAMMNAITCKSPN